MKYILMQLYSCCDYLLCPHPVPPEPSSPHHLFTQSDSLDIKPATSTDKMSLIIIIECVISPLTQAVALLRSAAVLCSLYQPVGGTGELGYIKGHHQHPQSANVVPSETGAFPPLLHTPLTTMQIMHHFTCFPTGIHCEVAPSGEVRGRAQLHGRILRAG